MLRESLQLSVVVVNWNTQELLAQCLESVYRTVGDITFEVLVIDNGSSDGSARMVSERYPRARIIENATNVGFARGSNQGMRASTGRYVLLLNSDAVVQADTVAQGIAFLDSHLQVGIVGAKLLNPDHSFQASYNDDPTFFSELLTTAGLTRWIFGNYYPSHSPEQSRRACPVNWIAGAFMLARREAIDRVGLLDETLFMYSEELDWCYRFRQAGWQVYYLPQLQVVHMGGQSSRTIEEKKLLWLTQSRVHFLSKHHRGLPMRLLQAWLRLIAILKTVAWLSIAFLFGSRREAAWRKVRANWRLALWSEA